jgi:hypothetical protein
MASIPTRNVGSITGANLGEWLEGISFTMHPGQRTMAANDDHGHHVQ